MSVFQRITVALVVAMTAAIPFVPGAEAQGDTFGCDPGFYQVITGQFAEFDPGAGSYTTLGPDTSNYNAMGYRIADGYMYGVSGSDLHRIDANGVRTTIATLDKTNSAYTGDFGDDGLLHVSRGGAEWTTINVETFETTRIPELSVKLNMADITNVNGKFYGVSSQGNLIRIDPIALTVTTVGRVSGLPDTPKSYGAAWSTAGGNLYVGRNTGEIYQITGYSTSSPTATQVGSAPATNSNDGASCSLAPPPPGLADVDGPEPETQPSTPEGEAAAKEYESTYEPTPLPGPTTEPEPEPEPEPTDPETTYEVEPAPIEGGETCGDSPIEVRPPRDPLQTLTMVEEPTVLYSSGFDDGSAAGWKYLSGDWVMEGGNLSQITDCDFDATALMTTHTLSDFRWSSTFAANDGLNHGGLLFHQSSPYTRSGATLVDFADGGSVIRWGSYDNGGFYRFEGMQPVPAAAPGQIVTLSVEVHGDFVKVSIDNSAVAYFQAPETAGMVGVVATKSQLSFGSAELIALPPETPEVAKSEEAEADPDAESDPDAEAAPAEGEEAPVADEAAPSSEAEPDAAVEADPTAEAEPAAEPEPAVEPEPAAEPAPEPEPAAEPASEPAE